MTLWWLLNSLSFIVFVITAPFNIYYLYVLIKNKSNTADKESTIERSKSNDIHMDTYRSSICGIVCFVISSVSYVPMFIAYFIYYSSLEATERDNTKPLFIVLWDAFNLLFYVSGIWVMLFTFLLRIDHAFQSPTNAFLTFPIWFIRSLYIYVITIGVILLVTTILYAMGVHIAVGIITPLCVFMIIIYDIILLYTLFSKLFRIFAIRGTANLETKNENDNNNNNNINSMIIELDTLQTTTRYSALILLGVISTFIFATLLAVERPLIEVIDLPGGVWIGLDTYINATALFLMFAVNKGKYNKYCSKYHSCLLSCCINCTYKGTITTQKTKEEYANLVLNDSVVL